MAHPVQTNIIRAILRDGSCIDLDGSNPTKAARQFASWWRGGLLDRVADDSAPLMSKEELRLISSHAWLSEDGARFDRVYYDGDRRVFPESDQFSGVRTTPMASSVGRAIDNLAHRSWTKGMKRIERATAETKATLATENADRYAEGLAEVAKLDAAGQLRAAINAMKDPVAKAQMREKYRELFSDAAVSEMAQAKDAADREARIKEWEKQHQQKSSPAE